MHYCILLFTDAPKLIGMKPIINTKEGDKTHLECQAIGYPPPKITWFFAPDRINFVEITNDAVVHEETLDGYSTNVSSKIMFGGQGIQRHATGNYHCVAKNTEGSLESRSNVTVECKSTNVLT